MVRKHTPRPDHVNESVEAMERRLARGREYLRQKRLDPEWHAKKKAYLKAYHDEYRKDPVKKAARDAQISEWGKANRGSKNRTWEKWRVNRRGALLIATARQRAKKKGIPYDLDGRYEDIQRRIDAGFCEVTGYPFDLTQDPVKGSRRFDGPSLDRIDNSLGYTYDNVRVVLNIVNYGMNIWGEEALRKVMSHWLLPK